MWIKALKTADLASHDGDNGEVVRLVRNGANTCVVILTCVRNMCIRVIRAPAASSAYAETTNKPIRKAFNCHVARRVLLQLVPSSTASLCFYRTNAPFELWKRTSYVDCELFGYIFSKSGVNHMLCSHFAEDYMLDCPEAWNGRKNCSITSGAIISCVEISEMGAIVNFFESKNVHTEVHCRNALISLHDVAGINNVMQDVMFWTTSVELSFYINNSNHGFNPIRPRTSMESHSSATMYGMFVWNDKHYVTDIPPPLNVEDMYQSFFTRVFKKNVQYCLIRKD